jgi:hypothetical protein
MALGKGLHVAAPARRAGDRDHVTVDRHAAVADLPAELCLAARDCGGRIRFHWARSAPQTRAHRRCSPEEPRPQARPCDGLALDEISQREPSSLTVEIGLPFASEHSKLFIHSSRL